MALSGTRCLIGGLFLLLLCVSTADARCRQNHDGDDDDLPSRIVDGVKSYLQWPNKGCNKAKWGWPGSIEKKSKAAAKTMERRGKSVTRKMEQKGRKFATKLRKRLKKIHRAAKSHTRQAWKAMRGWGGCRKGKRHHAGLSEADREAIAAETVQEHPARERGVRQEWLEESPMQGHTVAQLQAYMSEHGIACPGCVERAQLIDAILTHTDHPEQPEDPEQPWARVVAGYAPPVLGLTCTEKEPHRSARTALECSALCDGAGSCGGFSLYLHEGRDRLCWTCHHIRTTRPSVLGEEAALYRKLGPEGGDHEVTAPEDEAQEEAQEDAVVAGYRELREKQYELQQHRTALYRERAEVAHRARLAEDAHSDAVLACHGNITAWERQAQALQDRVHQLQGDLHTQGTQQAQEQAVWTAERLRLEQGCRDGIQGAGPALWLALWWLLVFLSFGCCCRARPGSPGAGRQPVVVEASLVPPHTAPNAEHQPEGLQQAQDQGQEEPQGQQESQASQPVAPAEGPALPVEWQHAVQQLTQMGFTQHQARNALRASGGDVANAVEYAVQRAAASSDEDDSTAADTGDDTDTADRKSEAPDDTAGSEEWTQVDSEEAATEQDVMASEALVSEAAVAELVDMGFEAGIAQQALTQADGNRKQAIRALVEHERAERAEQHKSG